MSNIYNKMRAEVFPAIFVAMVCVFLSLDACGETPAKNHRCDAIVSKFLKYPEGDSYKVLQKNNNHMCWTVFTESDYKLGQLHKMVRNGNKFAAKYLASILEKLGGGQLEDSLIALGMFGKKNMVELFRLEKDGIIKKDTLCDALTMLPLSLSDNSKAQLSELKARRVRVLNVNGNYYKLQKNISLKAIDDYIAEIKTHPAN